MQKILISTGGTGGHVIPAQNIKEYLEDDFEVFYATDISCLLYTSPSPRDISGSRMPSSA